MGCLVHTMAHNLDVSQLNCHPKDRCKADGGLSEAKTTLSKCFGGQRTISCHHSLLVPLTTCSVGFGPVKYALCRTWTRNGRCVFALEWAYSPNFMVV